MFLDFFGPPRGRERAQNVPPGAGFRTPKFRGILQAFRFWWFPTDSVPTRVRHVFDRSSKRSSMWAYEYVLLFVSIREMRSQCVRHVADYRCPLPRVFAVASEQRPCKSYSPPEGARAPVNGFGKMHSMGGRSWVRTSFEYFSGIPATTPKA